MPPYDYDLCFFSFPLCPHLLSCFPTALLAFSLTSITFLFSSDPFQFRLIPFLGVSVASFASLISSLALFGDCVCYVLYHYKML